MNGNIKTSNMTTQYNNNLRCLIATEQLGKGRSVMWDETQEGKVVMKVEQGITGDGVELRLSKELMENLKGDCSTVVGAICATIDEHFAPVKTPEEMEESRLELGRMLTNSLSVPVVASICFHDEDSGADLTQQQKNYITDAVDWKLYEETLYDKFETKKGATMTDLVETLCFDWLKQEKAVEGLRQDKMGWGGNWSNGQISGLWADICFQLKLRDDFKSYAPHGAVFLGVRLQYCGTKSMTDVESGLRIGGVADFKITQMSQFYEPKPRGKTTKMFPNFGTPHRWTVEVAYEKKALKVAKKIVEAIKEKEREEKRLAHEAFLAEQREREREWRARLEADLAATIVAYNADEENLKRVIRFNREKVAEPLAKRIEAKEKEREREEAERRHAEKLKQKEAERLAKFASKQRK